MVKGEIISKGGRKPKNAKAKRELAKLQPQLEEKVKKPLILKGESSSSAVTQLLKDLRSLRASDSVYLSRKTGENPFNDSSSAQFLCERNDCGLFVYGSHSKKRPHNIVFGRMYDGNLLDMFEFGIENLKHTAEFLKETSTLQPRIGSKPLILAQGPNMEGVSSDAAKFRNYFVDYFRGHDSDGINVNGIEHAVMLGEQDGKLLFRHYAVRLRKEKGKKSPSAELTEIGPRFDLVPRRTRIASADMWKHAIKQPKGGSKVPSVKNVSRDSLGNKVGRLHPEGQDFKKIELRKTKAVKKIQKERRDAKKKTKKERK
uniref:Ribosome production factor 2 homolog n=1 Tax=Palpitomonas bilix TaxID=652834 RepID=A0A7S3G6A0_9EUKA|mmetsp:Transcript_22713/g.57867  ORF Transcript_22713/g.57867 Transcript_22713/m.57867 type:complete len:315 (+) Transcript_22713:11-955(+)